ncbi:MAG: hypothetical protein E7256_10940 [Lachnospiraceae bacterium]|nr:hypothetical protein [Lachnospiraceae bacterium]
MRKIMELVLWEIIVLDGQKILVSSTSVILFFCVGISVALIAAVVQLIGWIYGKEEAEQMNRKL